LLIFYSGGRGGGAGHGRGEYFRGGTGEYGVKHFEQGAYSEANISQDIEEACIVAEVRSCFDVVFGKNSPEHVETRLVRESPCVSLFKQSRKTNELNYTTRINKKQQIILFKHRLFKCMYINLKHFNVLCMRMHKLMRNANFFFLYYFVSCVFFCLKIKDCEHL
jgi:hypothetical protein